MDLRNILHKLDKSEKTELARLLHQELNIPDLGLISKDASKDRPVRCPHCEAENVYGHGTYKGRRRYKCRSCSKTFNDFTSTAVDGIKKLEQFQEYLLMVVESVTIRKAAKEIGVNMKTIFDWRLLTEPVFRRASWNVTTNSSTSTRRDVRIWTQKAIRDLATGTPKEALAMTRCRSWWQRTGTGATPCR
tara:strand:- start:729 stop:1298 length:570 start_codon:yes stop_codon:yes gene_type:complete